MSYCLFPENCMKKEVGPGRGRIPCAHLDPPMISIHINPFLLPPASHRIVKLSFLTHEVNKGKQVIYLLPQIPALLWETVTTTRECSYVRGRLTGHSRLTWSRFSHSQPSLAVIVHKVTSLLVSKPHTAADIRTPAAAKRCKTFLRGRFSCVFKMLSRHLEFRVTCRV